MLTTSRNQNRRVPSATPHRHPNNTHIASHYCRTFFSPSLGQTHRQKPHLCRDIGASWKTHVVVADCCWKTGDWRKMLLLQSARHPRLTLWHCCTPSPSELVPCCRPGPPPTPLAVRSVIQSATPRGALSMF